MKQKSFIYWGYGIVPTRHRQYSFEPKGWDVLGYVGETINGLTNLPSVSRAKLGIRLYLKFSMNPPRLNRYLSMLRVNRYNYSGCYGKLIPISKLKSLI